MILREIHCSVSGCKNWSKEEKPNAGWAGWGHIHIPGLVNPETGEQDDAHVCPECKNKVLRLLKGEIG